MKNYLLFTILLMLLSICISAQSSENKLALLLGPTIKESNSLELSHIIGHDETGIYNLKVNNGGLKRKLLIEHVDSKMKRTKIEEINLEEQKKGLNYEFLIHSNDELYLFSSFPNLKLNKNILFVQTIDKSTLKINSDLKVIEEISFEGNSKYNSGGFHYTVSEDKSKILIYHYLPYERKTFDSYGICVYDKSLKPLWKREISFQHKSELYKSGGFLIDNRGEVYCSGKVYLNKAKHSIKGKPNYFYEVLGYSEKEEFKHQFKVKENFLNGMTLAVNDNFDLFCTGYYKTVEQKNGEGAYLFRISGDTKKVLSQNFYDFDIDFLTQNLNEKEESKARKRYKKEQYPDNLKFTFRGIRVKEDGGVFLAFEEYRINVTEDDKGRKSRTYYYNDISVLNISPNDDVIWTSKIPKRQRTSNDGANYSSFVLSEVGGKLHFLFNDNASNLKLKPKEELEDFTGYRGYKDALLTKVSLDNQGKQTREALYDAKDSQILNRPRLSRRISDNELVLYNASRKDKQFTKVTF